MGKLKDLWAELRITTLPSRREELQKEINRIEQYCIDNGYADITELTTWNQPITNDYETRFDNPRYPDKVGVVFFEDYNL